MNPRIPSQLLISVLAASASLFLASCAGVINPITSEVQSAEALVRDAIGKLETQSVSWQSTLNDLTSKLTDDTQSTLRNEVQNLLNGGIAAAGSEFRCDTDFVGNRIKEGLERILAGLEGRQPQARTPILCQVVPGNIDMALASERRNLVVISGYNFGNQSGLKLFTVTAGRKTDVTYALNRLTDYEIRLNLGANGIVLLPTTDYILVDYNGNELTRIPVIQVAVPDCQTGEYTFAPTFPLQVKPGLVGGDKEFFGHGPRCTLHIELYLRGQEVRARFQMTADETHGGDTRAEGTTDLCVQTIAGDMKPLEILTATSTDHIYTDTDWEVDIENVASGEVVSRFECLGDGDGEDVDRITSALAFLNPIRIKYKQTVNCK